jgi:hypothetical protein
LRDSPRALDLLAGDMQSRAALHCRMGSPEQAIRTPLPLAVLAEWRRHGLQAPVPRPAPHRAAADRHAPANAG